MVSAAVVIGDLRLKSCSKSQFLRDPAENIYGIVYCSQKHLTDQNLINCTLNVPRIQEKVRNSLFREVCLRVGGGGASGPP